VTSRRVASSLAAAAVLGGLLAAGGASHVSAQGDLDQFMAQVLATRDDNWKKLQQYILDEHESIDVRGPTRAPLWGERRDYTWFVRDGFFVRSPVKVDGVTIADDKRREYEDEYLRRLQRRERFGRGPSAEPGGQSGVAPVDQPSADLDNLILQTRQPEFISSSYFLRFRFDEGRYALVGREKVDGRELLRIEYYPTKLFAEGRGRGGKDSRSEDEQIRAMMNKASLVTLWIEPQSHQIVKYTVDNITPNFIPANWFGRVTEAHASMTMGQPFPDVWLPNGLEARFTLTLAFGDVDLRYALDYADYRRADVTSTLHVPDVR